jgi:amino acid adenylation domain-containing protein
MRFAVENASASLVDAFESVVAARPDAVAAQAEDRRLTHEQLDRLAADIARRLRELGVGRDEVVGVMAERGLETVVAAVAVAKAGGAYAPLDPDSPRRRTLAQLAHVRARAVLAPRGLVERTSDIEAALIAVDAHDVGEGDVANAEPLGAETEPSDLLAVVFTSGSSGRPKAVAVEHRNLLNLLTGAPELLPLAGEGALQVCAPQFDLAIFEIWATLLAGGRLVCHPPGRPDPAAVRRTIVEHDVGWGFMATSTFHQLVEAGPEELAGLRMLIAGGEAMQAAYARRFRAACPGTQLVNLYGPAETTVGCTAHVVGDESDVDAPLPIGRSLAGAMLDVRTPDGGPVEPGEKGELWVGGAGVSRGYLHDPDLTAERFRDGSDGERWYRTGDVVRAREDGVLEIFGRVDDQVKLRGYRVEPLEVEAHVLACAGVAAAVVVVHEAAPGRKRLAAFVVLEAGATPETVRAELAQSLPAYMIPGAIVAVRELPQNPNGKVDRAVLRATPVAGSAAEDDTAGPLATRVGEVLAEVLGIPEVGAHDDFFALGGDSLLALQVVARLEARHGIHTPLAAIFRGRTAAAIAVELDGAAGPVLPPLRAGSHAGVVPATAGQAKALYVSELAEESLPYQSQALHRIRGRLDIGTLERALSAVVERHEILRTSFPRVDGHFLQRVHEPAPVRLHVEDLRATADPERALEEHFAEVVRTRLDPERLPLVRWSLARVADDDHVLIAVEHHVVHDGFTTARFLQELAELYAAAVEHREPALPRPAAQFRDFAAWQQEVAESELGRATLEHWRARLAEPPPELALPFDRRRPPRQTYRGATLRRPLPPALAERITERAAESGATVFAVMLAAYTALLARTCSATDVVLGTGVANRRTLASEDVLGMVVNTVPLRVDVDGNPTVAELIARVQQEVLTAHAHQDVPFETVVSHLHPTRAANSTPVYQTLFAFHDSAVRTLAVPGATIVPRDALSNGSAKLDLSVIVINRRGVTPPAHAALAEDGLTVVWEYNADLFDLGTAERMLAHYTTLLELFAEDGTVRLGELSLVEGRELERIAAFERGKATPYERDATIDEVFRERARERPDAIAVSAPGGREIQYGELASWARRLAQRLRLEGAVAGGRVGVCLDRSPEQVAAYLAVATAGAAYVPLDPRDPHERLRDSLASAGIELVLTHSRHYAELYALPARVLCVDELDLRGVPAGLPQPGADALSPAYVMFTSGSTGLPKGVQVPHRAILRLVRGNDYVELGPDQTLLALAHPAFDASTFELWGALLNGGRVVLAPPGPLSTAELHELVEQGGVTTLWLTAGLFHRVAADRPDLFSSLRQLLAGGDVLSPTHVRRALDALPSGARFLNGYGPTEGTTFTTTHALRPGDTVPDPVPIGKPIANTDVRIIDRWGGRAPIGAVGELCIGGDGVALGYAGDPALTAERFTADPVEPDARMYRSGDLARWRADGTIEFLGRGDRQLKVRGFRVEPGEVEEALRRHPAVSDVHVARYEREGAGAGLAAYVVPVPGGATDAGELRTHVARLVQAHAVPTAWSLVDRLPLSSTGKVDAAALPPPAAPGRTARSARPADPVERRLAALWERILDVDGVGADDDFFDLGGHSLLAVEMFDAIERTFGSRLPLATVFEAPTLGALAAVLREEERDGHGCLVALTETGTRSPLFFVTAGDGNAVGFGALARRLGPEQPFYALQQRGLDGGALLHRSIERMAAHYLRAIRRVRPAGPYLLGGRCLGSAVAYEIARRLRRAGEDVPLLVVLDSGGPLWTPRELADGVPYDDYVNAALQRARRNGIELGDPFTRDGADRLLRWLDEPFAQTSSEPVSRYLYEVYRNSPWLEETFPDLAGADTTQFLDALRTRWASFGVAPRFRPRGAAPQKRGSLREPVTRAWRTLLWRAAEVRALAVGNRLPDAAERRRRRVNEAGTHAWTSYRAGPLDAVVTLARSDEYETHPSVDRWLALETRGVREVSVRGTHRSILREPDVAGLAEAIAALVDET